MIISKVYAASLDSLYAPASALGGKDAKITNLINPIISNLFVVSGIVAFFVILFAGFTYISSAGDKNKLTQATNMLNYGILGLVIIVAAYLVTKIIGTAVGINLI